MSGIPQFNFPTFIRVAEKLRAGGWNVVSPAELDAVNGIDKQAMDSTDGDAAKLTQTWGDLLSRDVKLIADEGIEGIAFLPGWEKSRGARLEASVGMLCGTKFFQVNAHDFVQEIASETVAVQLFKANLR